MKQQYFSSVHRAFSGLFAKVVRQSLAALFVAASLLSGMASVSAAVPLDQSPLIIQKPLPPNIVLMLDDSGSMDWSYMPDWNYLSDTSDAGLRSSDVNDIYYNPNTSYTVPPKADGSSYANITTFPWAPRNVYNSTTSLTDIEDHYDSFPYYATLNFSGSCPSGTTASGVHEGYCYSATDLGSTDFAFLDPNNGYYYYYGGGNRRVFSYSVKVNNGYEEHYVTGSCSGLPNNVASRCDDSAAAQQNVANWFTYYRTRILMAKTGLMDAFSSLDSTYRFGFGSINGRNTGDIPSPSYAFSTSTNNDNKLAEVTPFGDGSSGTRKAQFWGWLAGESANNSTPLRGALKAVGQYYQTAQPWQSVDSNGTTQEYACRQSYAILTTDGFWNGSDPGVGNADGTSGATLGAESDGSISGPNNLTYTYNAAAPYSDSHSNTLADVAMYYWKNDLRTTTPNEVPTNYADPAYWQHMVTFTIGLGFDPTGISPSTATPDDIFAWAQGGTAISNFSWPTPSSNSSNNIADLLHAAVDGHGGFYSAKSPADFANGLKDALKRTTERTGNASSLAANSTKLDTGTFTYQANYFTGKWKGDLKAFAVDPTTKQIATTPSWVASQEMPAAANRTIYTYNPSGANAGKQYVPFSDPTKLSTAEQSALGSTATDQQSMINYLRGDATYEGSVYRLRDTPLGDIVHSQPIYVGKPDPNLYSAKTFTGVSSYGTFASNVSTRDPVIYVAANDGMLHGFRTTQGYLSNGNPDPTKAPGTEVYAYMPAAVITHGIKDLADKDYGTTVPHQYYNDGELTVADAYLNGAWKTILVGSTGRGPAKAIYALDITDPANIKFLWERSAGDGLTNSNYIGQMTGKPLIVQTSDGSWSVLIGNGYNSAANVAALLQFNLSTGAMTVHTTNAVADNGLAAPATFDFNNDGIQDMAYAGDLRGDVWSFDLSTSNSGGTRLFTATDSGGTRQPITAAMLVGKDPATSNIWLFFGTGRYLSQADLTDLSTQTWYGIIVKSLDSSLVSNLASSGRSSLVQRQIEAETTATSTTLASRGFSQGTVGDMTGKSGWYMDLTSPVNGAEGERMVTPNQFQGSVLIGTSRIPEATDVCNPSGRGWIMALNPFTGTNVDKPWVDVNGDGVVDSNDTITVNGKTYPAGAVGFDSLPNNPIFVGNSMLVSFDNGKTAAIETSSAGSAGKRVSWKELVN